MQRANPYERKSPQNKGEWAFWLLLIPLLCLLGVAEFKAIKMTLFGPPLPIETPELLAASPP